ncbi:MAG: alpha/beta hydrolase family protein [Woeseiaceae bacterium]
MRTRIIMLLASAAATLSLTAQAQPTVEELVSLPKYTTVALSPTGQHIAAAMRVEENAYMVVMDITDPRRPEVVWQMKPSDNESVAGIRWISGERLLFTTQKAFGTLAQQSPTGKVFAVDYNGKKPFMMMAPGNTTGRSFFGLRDIIDVMPEDKKHIKVRTSAGGRAQQIEIMDVYRQRRRVVEKSPFDEGALIADNDGNARFAVMNNDKTNIPVYAYKPTVDGDWVEFDSPFKGEVSPLDIADDGSYAFMTSRDKGNFGVVRLDLNSKEITNVLTHEIVPANRLLYGTDNETLVGAEFLPGLPEYKFLEGDNEHVRLWKKLAASFPNFQIRSGGFTDDGKMGLVAVFNDKQPTRYFLLDTETFSARYLFDVKPEVDADEMLAKESHTITSRDGVPIQAYVTRPDVESSEPLPTVMVIHGGPHGPRDRWQFDSEAQLLASRGYVVIQPNYRGSGGFGFEFERMGFKKWGREMQDDVTDVTKWAFEEGIADPNKTCIYGGSYGGYATLAGITREPDLYACAFAFVGVYDLPMMKVRGDIPDRESGRTFLDQALGTDKQDLRDRSPANHTDKIITPLYIAHGKADKRVPVQQYYNLRKKLDASGVPYEELLVDKEGHGFYRLENRVMYYRELLSFLERHIGPDAPGKGTTTASLGPLR